MVVEATHTNVEMLSFPPPFLPGRAWGQNYQELMAGIPFLNALLNSLFVAVGNTVLVLIFCSMGGYAFARYNAPGHRLLFAILLATMLVPTTTAIIPWFILMKWLHWINSFKALIIPSAANAFGIFWMRQVRRVTRHSQAA